VPDEALATAALVEELFGDWERQLSRFRPESDLSRLNAHAGHPAVVGELLFRVIEEALAAAAATDGAFDPTMLRHQERIGYDRSFETLPAQLPPGERPPTAGGAWRSVGVDARSRIVSLPVGAALDLGGIAKGMAVDAALSELQAAGVHDALVSAGGDLAVRGLPVSDGAWQVLVGERQDEVVPLARGALATSGVARRFWRQGDRLRHHILDPGTGEPAESGVREVTVAARTCAQAEAAATACFVLGRERGATFLRRNGLAGRLTLVDGAQLRVGSWPAVGAVAA
jgi:thiamine biosynthesis lipoprotein